jgi:LysR family hca operon transcriptional activator
MCCFVAAAEEGSLTVAAERPLHTAQPLLSRQVRDLEYEVGAQLMVRSARGVEVMRVHSCISGDEPVATIKPAACLRGRREIEKHPQGG